MGNEHRRGHYADMSDEEFMAELRKRLPDRSWTLGQMAELERRGFDSIASDEELHAAVLDAYHEMQETVRKALEPAAEKMTELARQFGSVVFKNFDPGKFRFPSIAMGQPAGMTEDLVPAAWSKPVTTPEFEPVVTEIGRRAREEAERAERSLELQEEANSVLRDVQEELAKSNERDWIDWVIFGAAIIAAVAAVAGVFVTLVV